MKNKISYEVKVWLIYPFIKIAILVGIAICLICLIPSIRKTASGIMLGAVPLRGSVPIFGKGEMHPLAIIASLNE